MKETLSKLYRRVVPSQIRLLILETFNGTVCSLCLRGRLAAFGLLGAMFSQVSFVLTAITCLSLMIYFDNRKNSRFSKIMEKLRWNSPKLKE